MQKKSKSVLISLLVIPILVIVLGFSGSDSYFEISRNLDIFTTLFKEVNAYYVDEIEPEPLMRKGIDSMLSSLDPYTKFIPEEELESYRAITTGQYGGIGVLVGNIDDKAFIINLYENYAAHKAGIKIGDEIVSINGKSIESQDPEEVTHFLKGTPNSVVNVTVKRLGVVDPISFQLKREKIIVGNVPYAGLIEGNVGYILLSEFTFGASKEVSNQIRQLKEKGAESIILDLRGNRGGLLNEAINIANIFIPKGKEIVSTKGKVDSWNKSYKALNMPVDIAIPLAILINNVSASASEIVAGVIQDYDRGVLVGRKTFGKGLVQTTRPLSYNAQLKVTTAKYYTPSGRCIQRVNYTDKNIIGEAEDFPDSLITEFKTSGGREIYDGDGLIPDVKVEGKEMADVTKSLLFNGVLFNYANVFFSENESIEPASTFELSDDDYLKFKNWVKQENFDYKIELESRIKSLEDFAKSEMLYDKMNSRLEELKSNIELSKSEDFDKYKEEIKLMLTKEIVSRYFLLKGSIVSTINKDDDIAEAVNLLQDSARYNKTLNR